MNQELIDQKRDALRYNEERHALVTSICDPLNYLDTDFFAYGEYVLNDLGHCEGYYGISPDLVFLKLRMFLFDDSGKCLIRAIRETPLDEYSYFLWEGHDYCPMNRFLNQYGFPKGLIVYKRHKHKIQAWDFSCRNSGVIPSTITQASVFPFLEFARYFENHAVSNKLIGPLVSFPLTVDMSYIEPNKHQMEKFKNAINANNFTLRSESQSISLSKREWECLSEIARGKTCKEIACDFSISPRTVEKHLDNIKDKAGVHYKSELVKLFYQHNSVSFF